jgi:hypothetical protein
MKRREDNKEPNAEGLEPGGSADLDGLQDFLQIGSWTYDDSTGDINGIK